jgi:Ca2+-binding RTX toxin-like protein
MLTTSFDPVSGVLTVTGTDAANTIEFGNNGTTFLVRETTGGIPTETNFDTAPVKNIVISTLAGSDTVIMGKMTILATLNGGKGNDRLSAGRGNDKLNGGGGDDYMFGGDGKDTLDGGSEGDDMFGGGGRDTITYEARTAPLIIGLGTLPDDGEAGEGDNARSDVEVVLGGSGSDNMSTGGTRPVNFYGFGGNDTLRGGNAGDYLVGGAGNDSLLGNAGDDTFDTQDSEVDTLNGGDGTDALLTVDSNDVRTNIP